MVLLNLSQLSIYSYGYVPFLNNNKTLSILLHNLYVLGKLFNASNCCLFLQLQVLQLEYTILQILSLLILASLLLCTIFCVYVPFFLSMSPLYLDLFHLNIYMYINQINYQQD